MSYALAGGRLAIRLGYKELWISRASVRTAGMTGPFDRAVPKDPPRDAKE